MPIISTFFGIYVRMYFADHGPPHIHVEYQGQEALISIGTGEVLVGDLPKKALRVLREWAEEHRDELMANWERGERREPFHLVPGADT